MTTERGLKLHHLRHHEAKPRGLVGELALQVEEVGTRDMLSLESVAARHNDIRIIIARRRWLQIRGAVIDSDVGAANFPRQRVGANECGRLGHCGLLLRWLPTPY